MKVRARVDFLDIKTGDQRKVDDEFDVDFTRYQELLCNGIDVEPIFIEYRGNKKKHGPKIIIYQKLLYCIGGIETWDYNLAKTFEDRDITFVFSSADKIQFMELSRYANVMMDDDERWYECDVFINANYDGSDILLNRLKAKKIYQTIHSDFGALKRINGWSNFDIRIDERTDHIFSASETAQKGLKQAFGYDSTVLPNILAKPDYDTQSVNAREGAKPTVFISLTRASEEKGIGRCIEMARQFKKEGRNFIWLLCSTLEAGDYDQNKQRIEAIKQSPEFIQVQPQLYSRKLLHFADYLVQLSDTEAYCYSVREALQLGVPVICSDIPEFRKIVKPGKNGYILSLDLHDLDTDKIFNNIPTDITYEETISPLWEEVLDGKV